MSRTLLINPSYFGTYVNAKVGLINPVLPILELVINDASTRKNGHIVEIFDLSGFEFGNDEVLKKFGKGRKASYKKEEAARLAKKAGIDKVGFFVIGLSPTESTMSDKIKFA